MAVFSDKTSAGLLTLYRGNYSVIDRPENATELPRYFARALLWVLRQREVVLGPAPAPWFDLAALEEIEGRSLDYSPGARLWDAEWAKAIGLWPPAPLPQHVPHAAAAPSLPAAASHSKGAVRAAAEPAPEPVKILEASPAGAAESAPAPVKSGGVRGAAINRPGDGGGGLAATSAASPTRAAAVLPSSPPRGAPAQPPSAARVEDDIDVDDLDDLLNEFAVGGGNFGSEELDADALIHELDESMGLSPERPADQSSSLSSSPTRAHAELDLDEASVGARLVRNRARTRGSGGDDRAAELRAWLGACWGIVEDWGHLTSRSGTEHTTMVYAGVLPRSEHAKWLSDASRSELRELVLKAFRYAVKFSYDCCLYGAEDTQDEMKESFGEYDAKWYFGPENSPGWAAAVEAGVPNLMAIWKDKGTSRGRVASLVESHMQVGRLNAEAARGLWASLSMELYYFTNDDDERYSIQSNTALLRNLMVQTAAPPLGYALFVCNAE